MQTDHNLPRISHSFFKWYCDPKKYEELHGDLEELFYARASTIGLRNAKIQYTIDVLRCFQPYAWKPISAHRMSPIMLGNYSKVTLRGLTRNPLTSFINIFGLSIAIGVCLVVYAFMKWDNSRDQFHVHKDEVFLTTISLDRDGKVERYGWTPRPLGERLKEDFPQVHSFCRVVDREAVVKREDRVFYEQIRFTDPSFLDMFTFPLQEGDPSSLADPNAIILSYDMAKKYFSDQDPIGQEIELIFGNNRHKIFIVKGLAAQFPEEHVIGFDFLAFVDNLPNLDPSFQWDNWGEFIDATLIRLKNPNDIIQIEASMDKYLAQQNSIVPDWKIQDFSFEQLTTLRERSYFIRDDISYNDTREGKLTLPIIAIFMLVLACFNYMNMAIVSAAKRLKEIGVRKVIGATRKKIISQFLIENILITSFALLLGVVLATFIFLPWFMEISDFPLRLEFFDTTIWIFLFGLLLLTGVLSGMYPALYIAGFQVVHIFRSKVRMGKKNFLTKVFLGAQLVLACMFIVGAVLFMQNIDYQNNRSWGYQPEGMLYVNLPDELDAYERLREKIVIYPEVISVTGGVHHLGREVGRSILQLPNRSVAVNRLSVGKKYLQTLGLKCSAGRFFEEGLETDQQKVVVNELFLQNLEIENAIGYSFRMDGERYEITGVVHDFHHQNFYYESYPTVFAVAEETDMKYISVRVKEGKEDQIFATLQDDWAVLFPHVPFQGGHQVDVWGPFYEETKTMARFMRTIATLAVLLAGMGLYGLVTLNVLGRIKEFSIKKVLGARLPDFVRAIGKSYIMLTALALFLGLPLGYLWSGTILDMMFAYPMPIGVSAFIISSLILIAVITMVILTQVRRVSITNPLLGLRSE